jgi:hypothetical protein
LLSNGGPDTPERIAERARYNAALEQMRRELCTVYPAITTGNADEILDWQKRRIAELTSGGK